MNKAILACSVFYEEIEQLTSQDDEVIVKLMPQGLHDLPDEMRMQEKIQTGIDELEAEYDLEYIFMAYGFCSGGVEGLTTKQAELVIPKFHDCIPLLLGDKNAGGKLENTGTYFLSRGWIDCGGDTYKQHLSMTEDLGGWIEKFKKYEREAETAVVEWYDMDMYNKGKNYGQEMAEEISFQCLKGYDTIVLIDNNNLEPIHYEYAEEMYEELNEILQKYREEGLEYKIKDGDLSLLDELIHFESLPDPKQQELVHRNPPGQPLRLEKRLIG